MAKIALCTGTTADWKSVESQVILEQNEIGVEIASRKDGSTYTIIRRGDGASTFFNLKAIFNQGAYEDALSSTKSSMNTVNNFATNMNTATTSAMQAATNASNAASKASAAAKACEGLVAKQNTMIDTVTQKACVLSVEDGLLTIREA